MIKSGLNANPALIKFYFFFGLFGVWVKADPATDFIAAVDLGLLKRALAFFATALLVTSVFFLVNVYILPFKKS
jgi:hypothetical protein